MPEDGLSWLTRAELMTYEEMLKICSLLVKMGIEKIRITGGEPFVRKDIMHFLTAVSQLDGLRELTITTNGVLTAPYVKELKQIGVKSVNLSLDTLDADRFFTITRRDEFASVMHTMEELLKHDIDVKINAVVMDGKNIADIIPLVELTKELPVSVRFIEEMPFNGDGHVYQGLKWDYNKILDEITRQFPGIQKTQDPLYSTAYNYHIPGHQGTIGIIAAYSRTFCGTCNRIRITPQGTLKNCLYDNGVMNIKDFIREGFNDDALNAELLNAFGNRIKDGWEAERLRGKYRYSRIYGYYRGLIFFVDNVNAVQMITVEEAEKIILSQLPDYGAEIIPFELSLDRILAEDIKADRDFPPFNRVTMDGIAIHYTAIENGICTFRVKATQAAGDQPIHFDGQSECIEIMTGSVLPPSADTVIRYEDLELRAGLATTITNDIKRGQNIHYQGADKKTNEPVAHTGQLITPPLIGVIASVGETEVRVKKLPGVAILSSGDELVEVSETPTPYQIRRSNNYTVKSVLQQHHLDADMLHIPDDPEIVMAKIKVCLENYDVLLLSGGISMGKFDYIPKALEELKVNKLFYKVQQRPGKPFWFGKHENGALVFAFPGNPVATFMCVTRYFLPWLQAATGQEVKVPEFALLDADYNFMPRLSCFLQVKLYSNEHCQLLASPVEGNGSGDFANLMNADAFMELPLEAIEFKRGDVYRIWRF